MSDGVQGVQDRRARRSALFLWLLGLLLCAPVNVAVIREFVAHGTQGNLGWGVVGIMFFQPVATLFYVVTAGSLAADPIAWENPRTGERRPKTRAAILVAGLLWSLVAYLGLLFRNAGC